MCIQWCCKNCQNQLTILTHHWARERCNDYYIARSENYRVTDCPRGPWELRRAFHRNPYKGAQRCNDCIKASRKDSKRVQQERQRTNMVHGERREYSGALNVGELVIPEGFQNTAQPLVRGQLDVDKSSRQDFALGNEHLPSHGLEHEWAKRFAASNVGVCTQSMATTSDVTQQMNGESYNQGTALADTTSRTSYQPVQHPSTHNTYKGKPTIGWEEPQDIYPYTRSTLNEPNPINLGTGIPQGSFQEIPYGNNFASNHKPSATVQGQASEETHREAQHQLHLPLRGSSSRSTRARPWDL